MYLKKYIVFRYLDRKVSVVSDGKEVANNKHLGFAGLPNSKNIYTLKIPENVKGNNGSVIRAEVRINGGVDSHGRVELIVGL